MCFGIPGQPTCILVRRWALYAEGKSDSKWKEAEACCTTEARYEIDPGTQN